MHDLKLISIFQDLKTENSYVNFHSHNYHELVYYPNCKGKTNIGGHTYIFSESSFVIIPPHVLHDDYHQLPSHVICIIFTGMPPLQQGLYKDPFGAIHKILKEILFETQNQKYGYREMIQVKLNELYLHIMRDKNTLSEEKNFEYTINYIKENYHEKLILSDFAKQLHLSYDYFQHKFKKITGYSPQQFLLKQRLLASVKLLQNSDLNCTEITYRCGFSTLAQFSALFKREYGMSPSQFRSQSAS